MGKTSYKNTAELINDLSERIDDLNNGKLGLGDLDNLVESGKSLYEHLVVLRHLAFEKHRDPAVTASATEAVADVQEEVEPVEETETELAFDLTGGADVEEEMTEEPANDLHFDFTQSTDEFAPEIEEIKQTPEASFNAAVEMPDPPKENESFSESNEDDADASLNDALKKDDELSLRKKLQNTPVSDIKTHISIAKKFEYISSLFNGDSAAYDEAIDFLNSCATGEDARLKLNEYTTQYAWNLEDKSIIKFIELVERRYISA